MTTVERAQALAVSSWSLRSDATAQRNLLRKLGFDADTEKRDGLWAVVVPRHEHNRAHEATWGEDR